MGAMAPTSVPAMASSFVRCWKRRWRAPPAPGMPSPPPLQPTWPQGARPRMRCGPPPSTPPRSWGTSTRKGGCSPKPSLMSAGIAMQDRPRDIRDRAQAVLASPHDWALFLDIDGTLLGMAPTPDAVAVPPELPNLLGSLASGLDGALAIVTGRRVAEADRLLAPVKLVASGVHGTELRQDPDGPIKML